MLDLKPGDEFTGLYADVTDDASVREAIDTAAERLGGIDILVNNAGIGATGRWPTTPTTNGTGCSTSTSSGWSGSARAALPYLRASAARRDRQHLLGRRD